MASTATVGGASSEPAGSRHRSVSVTVNLSAARRNLATARALSGTSRLFATIKADAYGHGAIAIAHALSKPVDVSRKVEITIRNEGADADGFAVVCLDEALQLRLSGIREPVLVLQGPQSAGEADELLAHQLWPVIHDMQQYHWFRRHPARGQLHAWLKVDTGMGRLGFHLEEAIHILEARDGISWSGLMTHFASADEPDNPFTARQLEVFEKIRSGAGRMLPCSLANSAAILAWPQSRADWARPGIMLYGCNPLDRPLPQNVALEPVMRVQAPLLSVKSMRRGAGIGYAQSWQCPEDMRVGYVAIGYGDGLPRVLDVSASVSLQGHVCPIVGRVSMDSIAIDLRQLNDSARVGEMVDIWGPDNPVDALATAAGTINYELLTSIRGSRTYVRDADNTQS